MDCILIERFFNRFTLLQSLVMMIAFSLLLPIPLLLGAYVHSTFKNKQEDFVIVSTKKFELSSEIFTEALWNFYPELAQTIVNQMSLDKSFASVTLKDSHGSVFLSYDKVKKDDELFHLEKNLQRNDIFVGTVQMAFRKEGLLESLLSDLFLFGSLVFLQIILISLVISSFYYLKIIKPIRRLVSDSEKLAKKELDTEFVWSGKDEINTLGRALDKTRIALKELFERLISQNEFLDERVKQRTRELEEASRYKSEFLANMSHEIRTPMNAIVGMCHLVNKTKLNEAQSNYILKIKDASAVLLRIINDILDFSKIEAGKLSLEHIAFDMHKEIKKSISIFSILAKEKNIDLSAEYIETNRFYRGDPYRIVQILNNFLSNAIKFTKEGEVSLHVKEKIIDKQRSFLVFSVKDTGEGISKEKQKRLFQAFSQIDASTTRKHGGTGLGLYICTQLADMMGGKITFESKEGVGSQFNFEIELEKVEGADVQKENGLDMFKPLHILLVDDDKTSRNILQEYIRSFGFFVTTFSDSQKAMDFLKISSEKFDLYIFDYHLGDINGISLYEKIKKELPNTPPALLITSDSDTSLKSRAIEAGFERFLVKPVNPSFLYDDITSLCKIEKSEAIVEHSKIDFSDKQILLVEDNEINLEVAIYLLKETEAKVSIAKNGFEAVEKVKNNHYDIILMDIQMPVMDGYEATKIIRKELHYEGSIIAMTANVMAHDIKKCIEIGMDEHISKPIDVEEFYGTLLNVFGKKVEKSKHITTSSNLEFDKQNALKRLGNNEELWRKTFCKFYDKYKNLEQDVQNLLLHASYEEIQRYIHTLKGLSGSIGANVLQSEAVHVENRLKAQKKLDEISFESLFSKAHSLFASLEVEYQKECHERKKVLKQLDKIFLEEKLQSLAEALEMSYVSKVKGILLELKQYENLANIKAFSELQEACDDVDFESALKQIQILKKEL